MEYLWRIYDTDDYQTIGYIELTNVNAKKAMDNISCLDWDLERVYKNDYKSKSWIENEVIKKKKYWEKIRKENAKRPVTPTDIWLDNEHSGTFSPMMSKVFNLKKKKK